MSLHSHLARLRRLAAAAALLALLLGPAAAIGASIHIDLAGIAGEDPVPGHPDAILVQTLELAPYQLAVVKALDGASPAIQTALALGTILPSAQVLFHDAAPTAAPDAVLALHDLLVSSSQLVGDPASLQERDVFDATAPALLYLELPGIAGESATPGHPGVIALRSFSADGSSFSVLKLVDAASLPIQTALAAGTPFASARLLLYDAPAPSGPPDATLVFENALVSSSQLEAGGAELLERDGFAFLSISQPVPEPGSGSLGAASLAALTALAQRWHRPCWSRSGCRCDSCSWRTTRTIARC